MMPVTTPPTLPPTAGDRLVPVDARTLPLVAVSLAADAGGGLARVVLEQRFHNAHIEPLSVVYSLPLPADAAVSGFAFRIGDRRIVGEIDRREAARERFELAILEGRTAALLDQERSSLFTQELGNVPPGADVVAEITIDQKLQFLEEGAWEWRFPTTTAPRYLGSPGRVPDAERVAQDVADGPMAVRMTFAVNVRDGLDGRLPESPSHRLRGAGNRLEQGDAAGVALDRDVVVRWGVSRPEPGLQIETARGPDGKTYALITIVPPAPSASRETVPRDVVLLLDVSGSMQGEPLAQAQRIVSALASTLGKGDSLEMIAFSSSAKRWKNGATRMDEAARRDALAWIAGLRAGGGTEMRHAIEQALDPLRADAQRQVVLVTDGQIGFESEVVAAILSRLPASSRVHVVGVGSATNRTLTAHAARAGRGAEILVGLGEDPERAAKRLVARTDAPVVVDLSLEGDARLEHAPRRLPDLFAGSPVLVAVRAGQGELVVRGRTASGPWEQRVRVQEAPPEGRGAILTLFARESVEDVETEIAAGGNAKSLDPRVEGLGLRFGVSTRLTSWVAVSEEPAVDPSAPLRRVRMPHELPYGTSVDGLGLRARAGAASPMRFQAFAHGIGKGGMVGTPAYMAPEYARDAPSAPALEPSRGVLDRLFGRASSPGKAVERQLIGRVVLRDGQAIVIVLTVAQATQWTVPADVEMTWDDGTTVRASVLAERSTAPGDVAALASVRLAIAARDARTIARIRLEIGGEPWTVVF
jgi:Ca-activated chloride channel family protein